MTKRSGLLRKLSQFLAFGLAFAAPLVHFHMLCPFGGLETFSRYLQQGLFVPKTSLTAVVLFVLVVGVTAVAGSVFCSWICPLGSFQDGIYRLSPVPKKLQVPLRINRALGLMRYAVLGLVLSFTWTSYNLVFLSWDPYYALVHLFTNEISWTALLVLVLVATASLFVSRPWCRWFCPLGAVLGVVQKLAPFTVRLQRATCTGCLTCARACPMGLDPQARERLSDTSCNRCGDCVESCPRPGTLVFTKAVPLAAALVLLAGFLLVPRWLETFPGDPSRQEISGGMTLAELASVRGLPSAALLEKLGLPPDYDLNRKVRDLEDDQEEKTLAWVKSVMVP